MAPWSPEEKLGDSSFTGGFLIEKLKENCGNFKEIEKNFDVIEIKAKDISEGSGYLSKVYKCDFTFAPKDHENPVPTFSVILKEPGMQCVEDAMGSFTDDKEGSKAALETMDHWVTLMHKNESTVYTHLPSENLPIAEFYGSGERIAKQKAGYLIMEYLEGGYFPELHEGLNFKQAKNLLDFVIDVQVAAIKSGDWWKTGLSEMNFGEDQDPNFVNSMMEKLVKGKNERFVELVAIYKKILSDKDTCVNAAGRDYINSGLPKIFTHGDMWTNNISFKVDPVTHKITDEIRAVIDWQIASNSNPFVDIERILLMCCSPEVRRSLEKNIVEYYIDELQKRLGEKSGELSLKKDEIEKCKKYAEATNLVFFIFMSIIHYREDNPETKKKQDIVLERLQEVMEDLLPMMKEDFPQYLS
ncbi:hypothetical protein FO519_004598 [Halicephalobus sp. NKZ332]|nr:hypothetical protein FO519_004598 [Halicephalobus sp. NKZ332]